MKYSFKRTGALALACAVLAGVTTSAHAQSNIPRPTPPDQPPIPAGLIVGARSIDRQDIGRYFDLHQIAQPWPRIPGSPAWVGVNAANVAAFTQKGKRGAITQSIAPLWLDSSQANRVSVSLGEGALSLDAIQTDADVVSVRVRDVQGNVVTVAQRAYRWGSAVESIETSVRVDAAGRLLPLPVVRLTRTADGTVIATRDGGFAEALIVSYRLVQGAANSRLYVPSRQVTIPAGEDSVIIPVRGSADDRLTIRAGGGYTPAPAEGSDVIDF